ncbi:DUF2891 family protein, partial [Streptomyces sp. NPDC006992]
MSTSPDAAADPALPDHAAAFAEVALANITREYPNAPAHLFAGPEELLPPRLLHPAFYGAYDWHSSVHMHWLLLRLLRTPWRSGDQRRRAAVVRALDAHLTPDALAVETSYLRTHPSFERPYGWAWLLALTSESAADTPEHPAGGGATPRDESGAPAARRRWRAALAPAAETVADLVLEWLPKATRPV